MFICNIAPSIIKGYEFYKHKGTTNTKKIKRNTTLCSLCLCVYYSYYLDYMRISILNNSVQSETKSKNPIATIGF